MKFLVLCTLLFISTNAFSQPQIDKKEVLALANDLRAWENTNLPAGAPLSFAFSQEQFEQFRPPFEAHIVGAAIRLKAQGLIAQANDLMAAQAILRGDGSGFTAGYLSGLVATLTSIAGALP